MTNDFTPEAWPIPQVEPPPFIDDLPIEDIEDIDLSPEDVADDGHEYEGENPGLKRSDLFKSLVGLVLYPTTLVDDNSVPTGILYPDGTIVDALKSRVGQSEIVVDAFGTVHHLEVAWDGAKPDAQGHSKGLLIEEYETTGELWRRIALGGHGYFRRTHHTVSDDSDLVPSDNHV